MAASNTAPPSVSVNNLRTLALPAPDSLVADLGISSEVTTPGSAARVLAENLFANKYGPQGLPAPDPAAGTAFYGGPDVLLADITTATTAQKLLWLADHQYRDRKLIVWGATVHLMRQASTIDPNIDPDRPRRPYTGMVPMGEHLWRRVGPRAFVIGFTCYEGSNGVGDPADRDWSWHSEIRKDQHPSIELEELFNATGFDYAMVDLRTPAAGGEWLQSPIISRPLANQGMRAVWPNVLDAMFFIRVMQPNQAVLR